MDTKRIGEVELDMDEWKLLHILQNKGRIKLIDLQKKLNKGHNYISNKIEFFEKNDIIKRYSAILNCDKFSIKNSIVLIHIRTGFVRDEGHYFDSYKAPLKIREKYRRDDLRFVIDKRTNGKTDPVDFVLSTLESLPVLWKDDKYVMINGAYSLKGQYDILLWMSGTPSNEIGKYIAEYVTIIPGVKKTETLDIINIHEKDAVDLSPPIING